MNDPALDDAIVDNARDVEKPADRGEKEEEEEEEEEEAENDYLKPR